VNHRAEKFRRDSPSLSLRWRAALRQPHYITIHD